jgi:prepilin-type N-terminal cleavage/methylation domain-containing protein
MSRRTSLRQGFTLIELLVVLAILGVLTGLTLAAVQRARVSAGRASCMNRLKNLALAILNHESAQGRLPPGAVQGPFVPLGVPDGVSHGLWPPLLGYLEQEPLAGRYRLDRSFDHADNQPVVTARLPILQCPAADPDRVEPWEPPPRFGAVGDYGPLEVNPFLADMDLIDPAANFAGPLPVNGTVRLTDITDGTSQTLLLTEAASRDLAWSSSMNLIGLKGFFGGAAGHSGGAGAALADGSVRFLPDTLDLRVLARLATRAGGETLPDGF